MKTPGILDAAAATKSPDAPVSLAATNTTATTPTAQQRLPVSDVATPDDDASSPEALARKKRVAADRERLATEGKKPEDDNTDTEALLALLEGSSKPDNSLADDNHTSGKPRAISDHFRGGNSKKKPKSEEETPVAEGGEEHPSSEHAPKEEGALARNGRHLGHAAKYVGIGIASAAAGELAVDGGMAYAKGRLFDHETRGKALLSAGKSMLGNAGTVAKNVGWSLVPFYASYQDCKAGNYGSALMWGVVDAAGLACLVIPGIGEGAEAAIETAKAGRVAATTTEVVEGANASARAATGVADAAAATTSATDAVAVASTGERVMAIADKTVTIVNRASTVYTRVQLARSAEDFREFAFSPKGKVLGAIFYDEAIKGGVKPKDLAAFIKTQLPPTMPPAFADAMANQININNGTALATGSGKPSYRAAAGMTPEAGTGAGGMLAALGSRPKTGNTPV